MIVQVSKITYDDGGERVYKTDADSLVAENLASMAPGEQQLVFGRLVNLLLESRVFTPKDAGWELFFEDWK